jgi:hypothetical protein
MNFFFFLTNEYFGLVSNDILLFNYLFKYQLHLYYYKYLKFTKYDNNNSLNYIFTIVEYDLYIIIFFILLVYEVKLKIILIIK